MDVTALLRASRAGRKLIKPFFAFRRQGVWTVVVDGKSARHGSFNGAYVRAVSQSPLQRG